MAPRAILVTGASGFVGTSLIPALASAFPETRLIPASRRAGVKVGCHSATVLDPSHPEALCSALESLRPDVIVHLAGEAAPSRASKEPMKAWQSNVWQTLEFAELVRAHLPDAAFIHISSGDVYGLTFRSREIVDEEQRIEPASLYGVTKAAADLAIGEMALRGLHAVRLRPFNHTGPGQSADFVIPALARQVARIEAGLQEPVIHTGTLDTARDFLDVRDVCSAYVEVVRRAPEISPGTVFNISSGTARRIGDALRYLVEISGVAATIQNDLSRMRPHEIDSVRGDSSKAHAYLGWMPRIPFEQTLSDTLEWWRSRVNERC